MFSAMLCTLMLITSTSAQCRHNGTCLVWLAPNAGKLAECDLKEDTDSERSWRTTRQWADDAVYIPKIDISCFCPLCKIRQARRFVR